MNEIKFIGGPEDGQVINTSMGICWSRSYQKIIIKRLDKTLCLMVHESLDINSNFIQRLIKNEKFRIAYGG